MCSGSPNANAQRKEYAGVKKPYDIGNCAHHPWEWREEEVNDTHGEL
jgi:hypothetical protein